MWYKCRFGGAGPGFWMEIFELFFWIRTRFHREAGSHHELLSVWICSCYLQQKSRWFGFFLEKLDEEGLCFRCFPSPPRELQFSCSGSVFPQPELPSASPPTLCWGLGLPCAWVGMGSGAHPNFRCQQLPGQFGALQFGPNQEYGGTCHPWKKFYTGKSFPGTLRLLAHIPPLLWGAAYHDTL